MGLELKGVHVYETIPGSHGQSRLVRVNPYVRIARQGHPPIFVQGGAVYSEGGGPVDPLPEWFAEEMGRISPKVREQVGWREPTPDPKVESVASPLPTLPDGWQTRPLVEEQKPASQWTCPEAGCGQTMPTTKKGIHIARHRKTERAGAV